MGGMFQVPEQASMTPYLFQTLKLEYASLVAYFPLTFLVFSLKSQKAKVRQFSVSFLQQIIVGNQHPTTDKDICAKEKDTEEEQKYLTQEGTTEILYTHLSWILKCHQLNSRE